MTTTPASHGPAATTRRSVTRRLAEVAIPAVATGTAVVAPLLLADRLPDPVASHWGVSGGPDGSLPFTVDLVVLAVATALVAFGPLLAARLPMPRAQARILVAAAGGGAGLLGALRVGSLRANLDVSSWEAAGALGAGTIALTFAVAVVAAAVGWAAAGDRPDLRPTTSPASAVPVDPGETVVWTGGASGRVGVWVPVVLLAAAALGVVVLPAEAWPITLIVLPIAALVVAAVTEARVTVGPRGVTVALGLLGWPRLRVPVEAISDVEVEDVTPLSYGGWGLRVAPGATAVVVRRGEGLRITRRDGRRTFVVTVDDAPVAAGVLLANLGRATSAT